MQETSTSFVGESLVHDVVRVADCTACFLIRFMQYMCGSPHSRLCYTEGSGVVAILDIATNPAKEKVLLDHTQGKRGCMRDIDPRLSSYPACRR